MAPRPGGGRAPTFSKRPGPGALALILLVVLVAGRIFWQQQEAPAPPESLDEGLHKVQRVVDGDTLLMADGARLRLLGIDCPESVKPDSPVEPFGPEASEFTKAFIGQQQVRLQFDREREDQYGRLLAYLFVGDRMLNEELVREGLARYEPQYRYSESMKRRFRLAQEEAREARRGIWSVGSRSQ